MTKYLAILVVVLSGCATTTVPKTVSVPIAVPCVTATPNVPTLRYSPPYTTVFDAMRDVLGDREVSSAYEGELRAALRSCQ